MASLPVTIYQYAGSAFEDWVQLAWAGGAADHRRRAGDQHHRARSRCAAGHDSNEHHDGRTAGPGIMRASAACRRDPASTINTPRIAIRNLDFFYGDNRALKEIHLDLPDRQVTGMIGPSGCGKSTLLRVLNRMYSLYPGQRATGEVMMDGENIIGPEVDLNALRARIGMVFQKPTPFPMTIYDNIAFGVKLHERLSRAAMDERVEWSLTRAALWGEVKDRLHDLGDGPVRRPAAAAVHRAHHRGAPRGDPARRADQRARPDQHAEGRGADRRAEARLHHRHRHAQHAAGGALRRPGGVLLPGRDGRGRAGGADCSPRRSERRTQEYITGRFG